MAFNHVAMNAVRAVLPAKFKKAIRTFFVPTNTTDYIVSPTYNYDCLTTYSKSVEWMSDPSFKKAYAAGMDSGHKIGRTAGSKEDIHIEWRAHICCWAARHALLIDGDFVECGVNTGIMSLTICNLRNFNKCNRSFFLFDTFEGIPIEQMSATEKEKRIAENKRLYEDCYDLAKNNFKEFKNAVLVKGRVPDSLSTVNIRNVSYLHLDMNIAYPEVAALEYFWPKLVPSAIVVLDDYGWLNYSEQRYALDEFAKDHGVYIATLPTGQGLIIKPTSSDSRVARLIAN
jgi:O-methyltransferase